MAKSGTPFSSYIIPHSNGDAIVYDVLAIGIKAAKLIQQMPPYCTEALVLSGRQWAAKHTNLPSAALHGVLKPSIKHTKACFIYDQ